MARQTFKGLFAAVLLFVACAFGFALPTNAYAETYSGNQTIKLDKDVTDVVIESGAEITIDLNGHTISSSADTAEDNMHHAITNNGTLIINGSGTVDGGSYSNSGALYTAPGATTKLNGGLYTSSKWYVIKNLGTMIINDGVTVTSYDPGSSVIANGYYGGGEGTDCWLTADGINKPKLTVNGGIFNSDPNIFTHIKNDDYGVLVVNDGTFTGTNAVSNHYIATINDGSFTSEKNWVIQNCPCNSTSDVGEFTINGGTFTYTGTEPTGIFQYLNESNNFGFIKVSGGIFSDDPSKYVATDYRATDNGDGTYSVVKGGAEGTVETNTDANTSIDETTKEEVAETATDTAKSLKDDESAIDTKDNTVAGLKVENAAEIANVVNSAADTDTISVDLKVSATAASEDSAIKSAISGGNETAQYFDVSVAMTVTVKDSDTKDEKASATTPVTDLGDSEIEVTFTLDKATINGQFVRIARVHDGNVDYLPADVNYETGEVTFKTSKFSAYAVLYSTKVTVTLNGNGGTWDAEETKTIDTGTGQKIDVPTAPTRSGYSFKRWTTDQAGTTPFSFGNEITENITLYAQWMPTVGRPEAKVNTGLTYTGAEQTGVEVPEGDHYTVTGNKATNAGEYTATITLESGYLWADGGSDPIEIPWSIGACVHKWDEGKVTKEATVIATGTKTYTCTVCGVTKTETLAKNAWARLWGEVRLDTMQEISKAGWTSVETVIVASSEKFPDALAASSLAGAKNCPVLLTSSSALSEQTKAEIARLGAKNVYIIGGTAAVSETVESDIKALGVTVKRLAGAMRQETAVEVAKELGSAKSDTCIIATGAKFADALSISSYAYAKKSPIYLTQNDGTLSSATLDAIKSAGYKNAVIVGGVEAVFTSVEKQLSGAGIASVERLAGEERYETSTKIAEWAVKQGMSVAKVGVASGKNFPDALAGGAFCGSNNSVIVLASDSNLSCITGFVTSNKASITQGYVFGGKEAVSETIVNVLPTE